MAMPTLDPRIKLPRAKGREFLGVVVFSSADPEYFISHVDLTRIAEYRQEAARLTARPRSRCSSTI